MNFRASRYLELGFTMIEESFLFRKRICFSGNSRVKISSSIRGIYAERKDVNIKTKNLTYLL